MTKRILGLVLFVLLAFLITSNVVFAWTNVITRPIASFNATQFYFSYVAPYRQEFFRVYIDTTRDPNTGFKIGGIGAKYLLEGKVLYAYVGPGWNWKMVKDVPFNLSYNKTQWTINRTDPGNRTCAGAMDYIFQTQAGSSFTTTGKMTLSYTAGTGCTGPSPTPTPPPPTTTSQKIAVPSYFWPNCANNPSCDWNRLNNAVAKVGITIINPNSGVGSYADPAFVSATKNHQAVGGTVLGYVYTSYGARSISSLQTEINNYYSWYHVDGIFFDEGYGSNCDKLTYYQALNQHVKSKGGKAVTVINYGTHAAECYINASDILLTFEGTYSSYVNYRPSAWTANYPANRFYHLIYATTQDKVTDTINRSKTYRAGWIYVTPLTLPNPWLALPTESYWTLELNSVN